MTGSRRETIRVCKDGCFYMRMTPFLFICVFFLVVVLMVCAALGLHLLFDRTTFGDSPVSGTEEAPPVSRRVVIDAGHGGEDGGAPGPDGTCEKEYTLPISRNTADFLTVLGYEVTMTRTEDCMMSDGGAGTRKMQDMRHRLATARACGDALFVSVHLNRFPQADCRGLQVYYSSNNGESRRLAHCIQEGAVSALQPDNHRVPKAAGSSIYLLDRLDTPAVLVECGFLSNPDEAAMLRRAEYRQELAFVMSCAVAQYAASDQNADTAS